VETPSVIFIFVSFHCVEMFIIVVHCAAYLGI